jgi:hypothetical protein
MPTFRTRLALLAALSISTAAALPGCKKNADSIPPDGSTPGGEVAGGTQLRYKPGDYKLKQDAKLTFKASSPQGVQEASLDVSGLLTVSPSGADRFKVAFTVSDVRQLDFSKEMLPKPKEGETAADPKTAMLAATGASIRDLRGETVEDATKALPENAGLDKKEGVTAMVTSFAFGVFGPPELPEKTLIEGTPVKVSEQKEEAFFGLKIPMDSTSTYTLIKIDTSSGKRIAEVKYEAESSGAREEGKQMLTVDVNTEGTILFNLDDQLPVSRKGRQTTNISAGEMNAEIANTFEATYAPA